MVKQLMAGTLLLALLFWGGWQYQRASMALEALEQLQLVRQHQDSTEQRLRWQITLLKDQDTQLVGLSDGAEKVVTRVYHNSFRKETALDLGGIPAPPAGQYLQFWSEKGKESQRLGMIPQTAIGSWHPVPYQEGVTAFFISQDQSPQGDTFPSIVLMRGRLGDSL
jgi:hypothetical protein